MGLTWIYIALAWAGSLIIAFIVASRLTLTMLGHESSWSEALKSTSDLMTSLGILGAGAWALYLVRRRRSLDPQIQLIHHAQLWRRDDLPVLRIAVEIRNPSEVMIEPGDGNTSVQTAPPAGFDPMVYSEKNWIDIIKIRHCLGFEQVSIEPKESETYTHDVPIPSDADFIQITTELACDRTASMRVPISEGRPRDELVIADDMERLTLTTLLEIAKLDSARVNSTSMPLSPAPFLSDG